MTRTCVTYFTGFGGADIGLKAAGYTHIGGVEYDPKIAAVAAANGYHATVADVRAVDPAHVCSVAPDWFHGSPVCKNASNAKTDGEESAEDIETAEATCRFWEYWRPPVVSIENVWRYRTFAAFEKIKDSLIACGYSLDYWHLNCADYGVPQTRKRLILLARRGDWIVQRPDPTHTEGGDMFNSPWVGWYEAIEDLIPTLPESQFAEWQMKRLPAYLKETTMLWNMNQTARPVTQRTADQPVPTVDTGMFRRPSSIPQAFLVESMHEPATTVVTDGKPSHQPKAVIVDGQTNDRGETSSFRHDNEPMYAVSASATKRPARALLIESRNANGQAWQSYGDTGTAARYFYQADWMLDRLEDADPVLYCAKASTRERNAGLHAFTPTTVDDGRITPIDNPYLRGETTRRNTHPTVKPIALARYLATLLLPPASYGPRRLLVPFSGSGSEMIGAGLAGWEWCQGIEREADHVAIARARLEWWIDVFAHESEAA